MREPGGLYIHVPFCLRKCGYCDFYSVVADRETRERYVSLVKRMLTSVPGGKRSFETVYFGGGTPSLLGAPAIAAILRTAAGAHELREGEITLECNPETVDEAFFREAAEGGINRVSIGLQTARGDQLRVLGRRHTRNDAARAVKAARRAGIERISLDLMLAIPGQTEETLRESIRFCVQLGVPHISAYLLKIEPDTPFARDDIARLCPEEDEQARLYLTAVDELEAAGLRQYEISNFARPGYESRHNLGYWNLRDYLGIGPAAHSYIGGRRFYFPRSLQALLESADPWSLRQSDGAGGDLLEYAMLRLRLREGLDLQEAQIRYGFDAGVCMDRAWPLVKAGFVRRKGSVISLTPRGFLLSNTITATLLGKDD